MNRFRGSPHLVNDVMTHAVVAVGPTASFREIVETLEKWQVSALPVLEGDGRVVGLVSEADLLPKEGRRDLVPTMAVRGRELDDALKASGTLARDLMSSPAVSVHADAPLAEAARAMARRRLKRLPVVDGEGHLVGIVSRIDLLKVFLRSDEDIAAEVRQQVVDALPGEKEPTVRVKVDSGVVTFSGRFRDAALVPVAARMARAVEGVVDVDFRPAPEGETDQNGFVDGGEESRGATRREGEPT